MRAVVTFNLIHSAENPTASFEYLRPLLDFAAQYVPKGSKVEYLGTSTLIELGLR